ncbi:MarR family transcriptional regulator [Halolamina sp. CBA1230]|uniref:helix-turn-helix domain-containing protein n=1 Tax=Halolamina sp. CBA1230 TaxID=1853690 RepID=UPI0009A159B9|nr:helix-turn-helix domain-containing protein [Halolamina sp. CBA1230]QKY20020.1 MarR family transcriptional regulator [Halolamina sp. CBA1230]
MPISIDEFDEDDGARDGTNGERVVRFLARNRDQAYRASEIAEATGVDQNSIHPVLNRLKSRGLVRHRQPYWAADPEAIRDAAAFHSTTAFLDEEYGPESREEWLAAGEDDGSPAQGGGEDDGSSTKRADEDDA